MREPFMERAVSVVVGIAVGVCVVGVVVIGVVRVEIVFIDVNAIDLVVKVAEIVFKHVFIGIDIVFFREFQDEKRVASIVDPSFSSEVIRSTVPSSLLCFHKS